MPVQLTREELTRKLAADAATPSPVVVTVTEFGPFEGIYKEQALSGEALKAFPAWLEKNCGSKYDSDNSGKKTWIDVDGTVTFSCDCC